MITCVKCGAVICHEANFVEDFGAALDDDGNATCADCLADNFDPTDAQLEAYYNDGGSGSSPTYRQQMRDAGRGHLLGD